MQGRYTKTAENDIDRKMPWQDNKNSIPFSMNKLCNKWFYTPPSPFSLLFTTWYWLIENPHTRHDPPNGNGSISSNTASSPASIGSSYPLASNSNTSFLPQISIESHRHARSFAIAGARGRWVYRFELRGRSRWRSWGSLVCSLLRQLLGGIDKRGGLTEAWWCLSYLTRFSFVARKLRWNFSADFLYSYSLPTAIWYILWVPT